MDECWKSLQLAAIDAFDTLWNDFAKEGRESAVLAPLAQYPNAATWLARSMAMSTDYRMRKLGAMLAAWIQDPKHTSILPEILDRERKMFHEDGLSANSVGEDIMFSATRWTGSPNLQVRDAGIDVLAKMIEDSLEGIPWNTAHWAVANLHCVTQGDHGVFQRLIKVDDGQMEGQQFLRNAVRALQRNDKAALGRFVTPPSELHSLSSDDPHFSTASFLWEAAASAEIASTPAG